MKKAIFIFLFMTFIVSLISVNFENYKINKLDQDIDMMSHTLASSGDYGSRPLDNIVVNPSLIYGITASTIEGWNIRTTSTGQSGLALKEINPVHNPDYGFRILGDATGSVVGESNAGENFRIWDSNGTAENQKTRFVNVSQTLTIIVGRTYVMKLEFASSSAKTINAGYVINTGSNISTGTLIKAEDFTASSAGGVITYEFVATTTQVNLSVRHYATVGGSDRFILKNVGFYNKQTYEVQDKVYKMFTTLDRTTLRNASLETLQAEVNDISAYATANNTILSETVKNSVNQYVNNFNAIIALRDSLANAYTDNSKTTISNNVTQTTIDNMRAATESIAFEPYKTQYAAEFATVERDYQRKTNSEELATYAGTLKSNIDALSYLSADEKLEYKKLVDDNLPLEQAKINQAQTPAEANTALTEGKAVLDKDFLKATQKNVNNELDQKVNTETNNTPSAAVTTLLSDWKTTINSQLTLATVETERINALKALNLQIAKDKNNAELATYAATLTSNIDALTYLSDDEKVEYKKLVDDNLPLEQAKISESESIESANIALDEGKAVLDVDFLKATQKNVNNELDQKVNTETNNTPSAAVTTLLSDWKTTINSQLTLASVESERLNAIKELDLQIAKEKAVKEITDYSVTVKAKVDAQSALTTEEKDAYHTAIQTILDLKSSDINAVTEISNIQAIVDQAKIDMDLEFIKAKKANTNKNIDASKDALVAQINQNTRLTAEEKQTKIDELTTMVNDLKVEVSNQTSESDIETKQTEALNAINQEKIAFEKEDRKKQIDEIYTEKAAEINALPNVSQTQKDALLERLETLRDEAKTELNTKNTTSEIDEVVTELSLSYDTESKPLKDLNDAKQSVKDQLESHSVQPIDANEKRIIDEQVAKVTPDNYQNAETLEQLVNEGKTNLDTHYETEVNAKKDEVRTELETYAKQPITDEVRDEINKSLDKITKDNYENDTFIDTEKQAAKEKIVEIRKNEAIKELDDLVGPGTKSTEVQKLYDDAVSDINSGATPENIEQLKEQLKQNLETQLVVEEKPKAKQRLEDRLPKPHSPEVLAILNEANTKVDESTTLEQLRQVETEYQTKLDERKVEEDRIKKEKLDDLLAYFNIQKESHTFNNNQLEQLEVLYNQAYENLEEGNITLEQAKQRILNRVKDYKDLVYQITNGDHDIFDDNLEYPANSGNQVFAGLRNTEGVRRGVTIEITRSAVSDSKANSLREKFDNGTMTIPRDSTLTTTQTAELLNRMEYIRQLDASLKYADGTTVTEFFGMYSVSLLIPTEYRNYDQFLVVFETSNGIEVFKTYRTNAWLTFETPHFSTFYILGSEEQIAQNETESDSTVTGSNILTLVLGSIVIILVILIGMVAMMKKGKKAYSFALPLLALLSINEIGIITLVIISIISIGLLVKKIITKP